jgi:FKBP-type peptidyl-prolyl cis-trans isomerase
MRASSKSRFWIPGAMLAALLGCGNKPPSAAAPAAAGAPPLEITELKPGSGPPLSAGQKAAVNYTGWLYEASAPDNKGKEFDSSRNAGHPFTFVVGTGQVIKGWDKGVLGMKVGERRRLTIPADLGYGDTGAGDVIPPGATLIFDVDLVSVE